MKAIDRWKKRDEREVFLVLDSLELLRVRCLSMNTSRNFREKRARIVANARMALLRLWEEGQR